MAPELDRFLSPRGVDLMVTDQLQAIQVRVKAGLDVLNRRIAMALGLLARRRLAFGLVLVAGLVVAAIGWTAPEPLLPDRWITGGRPLPVLPPAFLAVGVLVAAWTVVPLFRTQRDHSLLSHLHGRYDGQLERCTTTSELQEFAAVVLAEATVIGAVPRLNDEEE